MLASTGNAPALCVAVYTVHQKACHAATTREFAILPGLAKRWAGMRANGLVSVQLLALSSQPVEEVLSDQPKEANFNIPSEAES